MNIDHTNALIGLAVLGIISVTFAGLLKWARCPGWAMVGGLIAGVLIGPTVLGRTTPELFHQLFIGGQSQRDQLENLISQQGAERLVVRHAPEAQLIDDDQVKDTDILEARRTYTEARHTHQQPLLLMSLSMVALMWLSSGLLNRSPDALKSARAGWITPLSIGIWSAVLPGSAAFLVLYWLNVSLSASMMTAAALAIGPWVINRNDRDDADHAELGGARLILFAGRIASMIALILAATILLQHVEKNQWPIVLVLAALPMAWLVPAVRGRWLLRANTWLFLPILGAATMMRIDVIEHALLWPLLAFLLISGDGRWLGAYFGAMSLGSRGSMRTMRLVLPVMSVGPTQLGMTCIALNLDLIEPGIALALVGGAIITEITAPARRIIADRIAQAEGELESLHNNENH